MAKARSRRDQHSPKRGTRIQSPTILSAEDTKAGRPGHQTFPGGPEDGKLGVTRVMRRDPAVGETLPEADNITNANVDLIGVGPENTPASGRADSGTPTRPTSGPSTKGKIPVRDKSTDSRVNVR